MGGSEKNEINAILNSKLKLELVEVGVELGKNQIISAVRFKNKSLLSVKLYFA